MWKQKPQQANYDYQNTQGNILANVRMVGIRGRWRWSCAGYRKDPSGWYGTKLTKEQAQAAAENYLRERGAL